VINPSACPSHGRIDNTGKILGLFKNEGNGPKIFCLIWIQKIDLSSVVTDFLRK